MPEPESELRDVDDPRRAAVWRLFKSGELDEDAATAHLLALDLETRRAAPQQLQDWGRRIGGHNGRATENDGTDRSRADAA